jgi:hypothetical protein
VADLIPPLSSRDVGKYMIRNAVIEEQADPWFWHYSRPDYNTLRASKSSNIKAGKLFDLEDTDYMPLEYMQLSDKSAFSSICKMISCRMFTRLIIKSLEKFMAAEENTDLDFIFASSLHIITLGLVSSNNSAITERFVENCVGYQVENTTLLHILLNILERGNEKQISEFIPQVKFILSRLSKNEAAKQQIETKLDALRNLPKNSDIDNLKRATEKEDKKQRRMKILNRFQSNQDQFIKNNAANFESETSQVHPDNKNLDFESGQCLVCHEDVNCDSPLYGILVSMHPSNLPQVCKLESQVDLFDLIKDKDESTDRKTQNDPSGGLFISTCSHLMHISCYQEFIASSNLKSHPNALDTAAGEFICPLCSELCNGLLPVIWENKSELKMTGISDQSFMNWWTSGPGSTLNNLTTENRYMIGQLRERFASQVPRLNRILREEDIPGVNFLNVPQEMQHVESEFMGAVKQYIGLYNQLTSKNMKITCTS